MGYRQAGIAMNRAPAARHILWAFHAVLWFEGNPCDTMRSLNFPHGFSSILPFTASHCELRIGSPLPGRLAKCVAPTVLVLHWGATHCEPSVSGAKPWVNIIFDPSAGGAAHFVGLSCRSVARR